MNLIDISSWQQGISLPELFERNGELDGVIVKLTQGTNYVNTPAKDWLAWLMGSGRPFGIYHYLDLYGARAEAEHFVQTARTYIGKAVLAVDYEGNTLRKGTGYLKEFLDRVFQLTGVRPLVYVSQSFIASQGFDAVASAGYQLWVAQYADSAPVGGFLENPWHKGSVAPFKSYVMQQYTSCGVLNGWKAYLDFDKFFGGAGDWNALCIAEKAPAELKGPDPAVVSAVLDGRYGVGQERIAKLREAGYDPQKVQAKIDELYGVAFKVKPLVAGNTEYMNSIMKIVKTI